MSRTSTIRTKINTVIFDFGGVIADEGFSKGLLAIGRMNRLDPEVFFKTVEGLIIETGYLTGRADEATFWNAVRKKTGITSRDFLLRDEIIKRFTIRPEMIIYADRLRSQGLIAVVLSDHTNWLDEIDQQTGLFRHFDKVFNSFHIHKSKLDATVFRDVCVELNVKPGETLFIDDNINHIQRAQGEGLHVIHFTGMNDFEKQIKGLRQFILTTELTIDRLRS
jgi:HAD superfamily hydrolase (TIGR01509 family)